MFGEKGEEKGSKGNGMETILGEGTEFEGNIDTRGSLRIEGNFNGKIKAEGDLFIGESGYVNSEIDARKVIIAGEVKGNIKASEKIELLSAGKINGDIVTKILKVEEGATFIGSSEKINGDKESISGNKKTIKTNFKTEKDADDSLEEKEDNSDKE